MIDIFSAASYVKTAYVYWNKNCDIKSHILKFSFESRVIFSLQMFAEDWQLWRRKQYNRKIGLCFIWLGAKKHSYY